MVQAKQSHILANSEGVITYALRRSAKARRVHVRVCERGLVTLTLPHHVPEAVADAFIRAKSAWIRKHQRRYQRMWTKSIPREEAVQRYHRYRAKAAEIAEAQLAKFNTHYNFPYGKVSIRNQTQRWGSCSPANNLSFNYRIALIPTHLADYVIVHELCHVHAHHHGPNFWKLVHKTIPDYRERIRALREEHRISFY